MVVETTVMNRKNSARQQEVNRKNRELKQRRFFNCVRQPEVRAFCLLICLDSTQITLLFTLTETIYPKI